MFISFHNVSCQKLLSYVSFTGYNLPNIPNSLADWLVALCVLSFQY